MNNCIYQDFYNRYISKKTPDDIDFIGINIGDGIDKLKLYERVKGISHSEQPIILFLEKMNMIRCKNFVYDSSGQSFERNELGLKNHTINNVILVINYLSKYFCSLDENKMEILNMCKSTITKDDTNEPAALYFLGNISNKVIKLHFLTRFCADANYPARDFRYDNEFFLTYYSHLDIKEMNTLTKMSFDILRKDKSINLWMAAADYFSNGVKKYKLYFKDVSRYVFDLLIEMLKEIEKYILAEKLLELKRWLPEHEELSLYGVAVCVDTNDIWSINCYFKYNDRRS